MKNWRRKNIEKKKNEQKALSDIRVAMENGKHFICLQIANCLSTIKPSIVFNNTKDAFVLNEKKNTQHLMKRRFQMKPNLHKKKIYIQNYLKRFKWWREKKIGRYKIWEVKWSTKQINDRENRAQNNIALPTKSIPGEIVFVVVFALITSGAKRRRNYCLPHLVRIIKTVLLPFFFIISEKRRETENSNSIERCKSVLTRCLTW